MEDTRARAAGDDARSCERAASDELGNRDIPKAFDEPIRPGLTSVRWASTPVPK